MTIDTHTTMKKVIAYLACSFFVLPLFAQGLNEEAALSYYWKNSLQSGRLYTDNGLGKELWIKNQPTNWIGSYAHEHFSLQSDGLFGSLLLSPFTVPKFVIQTQASSFGEMDAFFGGKLNLKKVNTSLLVNGQYFNTPINRNEDNFVDLPLKRRLFVSNIWEAYAPNYNAVNRIQYMALNERGGQLSAFSDTASSSDYETGLNMGHLSVQSQHLIALRKKDLLLVDFNMKDHHQKRHWGLRHYTGKEWLMDMQLRYEYHLDNGFDIFHFGTQYRYQRFDEGLDTMKYNRTEMVGGGFFGYDAHWGKRWLFSSNLNVLYHNMAAFRLSPSLKINYTPIKNLIISTFGANGWRYANPLTENSRYLFSNRSVLLPSTTLAPENAWYYGISGSYTHWVDLGNFPFSDFFAATSSRLYHTIYTQQVIADIDANAYEIRFYNLAKGDRAYKLSWDVDAQLSWGQPISITLNLDYRFDLAKTTIDGVFRDLPFYSRHNWQFNLNYACDARINQRKVRIFYLQNNWYIQSKQRIPDLAVKGNGISYPLQSKQIFRWDLQLVCPLYAWVDKDSFWKNLVFNMGIDNLTNARQPLSFLHANTPFDAGFDGGMTWNTMVGRRFWFGAKWGF